MQALTRQIQMVAQVSDGRVEQLQSQLNVQSQEMFRLTAMQVQSNQLLQQMGQQLMNSQHNGFCDRRAKPRKGLKERLRIKAQAAAASSSNLEVEVGEESPLEPSSEQSEEWELTPPTVDLWAKELDARQHESCNALHSKPHSQQVEIGMVQHVFAAGEGKRESVYAAEATRQAKQVDLDVVQRRLVAVEAERDASEQRAATSAAAENAKQIELQAIQMRLSALEEELRMVQHRAATVEAAHQAKQVDLDAAQQRLIVVEAELDASEQRAAACVATENTKHAELQAIQMRHSALEEELRTVQDRFAAAEQAALCQQDSTAYDVGLQRVAAGINEIQADVLGRDFDVAQARDLEQKVDDAARHAQELEDSRDAAWEALTALELVYDVPQEPVPWQSPQFRLKLDHAKVQACLTMATIQLNLAEKRHAQAIAELGRYQDLKRLAKHIQNQIRQIFQVEGIRDAWRHDHDACTLAQAILGYVSFFQVALPTTQSSSKELIQVISCSPAGIRGWSRFARSASNRSMRTVYFMLVEIC